MVSIVSIYLIVSMYLIVSIVLIVLIAESKRKERSPSELPGINILSLSVENE